MRPARSSISWCKPRGAAATVGAAADPSREKVQIERLRGLAADARLDPDFAEKFLNFIITEVIRHHEALRR